MGKESNPFEILDEGIRKNLSKKEYKKMFSKELLKMFNEISALVTQREMLTSKLAMTSINYRLSNKEQVDTRDEIGNIEKQIIRNCDGKIPNWNLLGNKENDYYETWKNKCCEHLEELLQIEPLLHQYMINLCPNWPKSREDKPINNKMIRLLEKTIKDYLGEGDRWDEAEYVIESGGSGNNLHAHIVAKPNKNIIASVDSHINKKGNHSIQLRKAWDKNVKLNKWPEGYVGCLKGKHAIQKIVLRKEEMIEDKKKYLIEELKPEGHKNLPHEGLNIRKTWSRF
jgi:hypothetical protein